MARLSQPNPASPVSTPLSPSERLAPATGRGSPDPGRVTTPFIYLGELPSDPTDLPNDGVARWWKVPGAVKCFLDGTKYTVVPPSASGHDAVTLAADAAAILGLSGQELNLDTQAANLVLAGPASGPAADPTFRALVAADIPGGGGDVATDAIWDAAGDLAVATGPDAAVKLAAGAAPAPNTTPTTLQSQWANVTGNARKVLAVTATGVLGWVNLAPHDIKSPAQILTFIITSDGVGDDAMVSAQKLWGSNAGTWDATMTYEGTPEAPTTVSESTGDADYPHTVTTPFTSASNMGAINSPAAVNGTIVFTLNATVDGVAVTKTYTVTYRNRRHWGVGGATIDSAGINALASEELSNTEVKSQWNDTLAAQYEWYCYPSRLGTATMWSGGFEGGFEAPTTVSHTNDKGKTEDYYCYRSSNPLTGPYSFEAKA